MSILRNIVVWVSLSVLPSMVWAADPAFNSYRDKGAVRGYDVVAYFSLEPGDDAVKGKEEYSIIWQDVPWYFSSAENLEKFKADPYAYAPQYGGYCAFAASKNFTTSIRPNAWHIYNGKLYLNHNGASKRLFLKDIDASIAEADALWPNVLTRCERRNNCRKPAKLPEGVATLELAKPAQPVVSDQLNEPDFKTAVESDI